ncbi:hypothetical protein SCHPADRAFT_435572 [Schizopora paradoxa]|uniref:Uncharacterized protein n=1 Tax=Schizopora paradoxa TaxID=27342 RepID=A0A0H2RJE6_9AGAM|nr:hypothetical protein SCHPADRAFT_435572 [Schizopora paradoxa]
MGIGTFVYKYRPMLMTKFIFKFASSHLYAIAFYFRVWRDRWMSVRVESAQRFTFFSFVPDILFTASNTSLAIFIDDPSLSLQTSLIIPSEMNYNYD